MSEVEEKIDTLLEGYTMMTQMVPYAIGVAEKEHVGMIIDVARLANLAAEMMLRDANNAAGDTIEALVKVAARCEQACKGYKDDENMKVCADECKRLAGMAR